MRRCTGWLSRDRKIPSSWECPQNNARRGEIDGRPRLATSVPSKAPVKVLSEEAVLTYILAGSGVKGSLHSGTIRRGPGRTLEVFDAQGQRFDYLSGNRVRSWSVVDAQGKPMEDWSDILPQDRPLFFL